MKTNFPLQKIALHLPWKSAEVIRSWHFWPSTRTTMFTWRQFESRINGLRNFSSYYFLLWNPFVNSSDAITIDDTYNYAARAECEQPMRMFEFFWFWEFYMRSTICFIFIFWRIYSFFILKSFSHRRNYCYAVLWLLISRVFAIQSSAPVVNASIVNLTRSEGIFAPVNRNLFLAGIIDGLYSELVYSEAGPIVNTFLQARGYLPHANTGSRVKFPQSCPTPLSHHWISL